MHSRKALSKIKPYVPGTSIEDVVDRFNLSHIVKMASNENPLGSPVALDELTEAMTKMAIYPDIDRHPILQSLADRYGLDKENLILGNGSDDLFLMMGLAFLNPGDECISSEKTFSVYAHVAHLMDASFKAVPMKDYGYDLPAMYSQVGPRTKLVMIANPNNPTGTVVTEKELEVLFSQLPEHVSVVLDQAYIEFARPDYQIDIKDWVARFPRLLVTRTFSKAYGLAGLRLGWSVSPPGVADLMNRIRQPFNVNSLAMAGGLIALTDDEHVEAGVAVNNLGLEQMRSGLASLDLPFIPSAGNFLTVEFSRGAQPTYEAMLREGVILRPVGVYGLVDYLRISIGTESENDRCLEALHRVVDR